METKMKIIWSCNGNKYAEVVVPADEVVGTIGLLLYDEWMSFGQDGDQIEIVEVAI